MDRCRRAKWVGKSYGFKVTEMKNKKKTPFENEHNTKKQYGVN